MAIHPTAIIDPDADISPEAEIGPYCIIGSGVTIGARTRLLAHAYLEGKLTVGKDNLFYPYCSCGVAPQDKKYKGEPSQTRIGDGNIIREFVTIHRGTEGGGMVTSIGDGNLLMAYVHIAHDCQLGNHIIMSNGASLAGHVEIGNHAIVGAFCGIHQFCRIGAYSFLGSYTIVNKDILPYSKTSAERPMGVYGANRLGLERVGVSKEDIDELQGAFRVLCRSKLNTTQAVEKLEGEGIKSAHVRALVDFVKNSVRGVVK